MKTNYHSHTKWCRHGSGNIEDFIKEAIKNNLEIYGVSEHVPYPDISENRIYMNQIETFMQELTDLQLKYKDKITILKGLECEYFPEFHDHYKYLKKKYSLDYLILGQHFKNIEWISLKKDFFNNFSDTDVIAYENALITGINSDLFDFVAHPDLYLNIYPFNEQSKKTALKIFQTCQDKNIPLEINANGIRYKRGYPNWDFWEESKQFNLTYIISSDCHHPYEVYDEYIDSAYEKAKQLNIKITNYLNFEKK